MKEILQKYIKIRKADVPEEERNLIEEYLHLILEMFRYRTGIKPIGATIEPTGVYIHSGSRVLMVLPFEVFENNVYSYLEEVLDYGRATEHTV